MKNTNIIIFSKVKLLRDFDYGCIVGFAWSARGDADRCNDCRCGVYYHSAEREVIRPNRGELVL